MQAELTFGDMKRFWDRVQPNPVTGCWGWTGGFTSDKGNGIQVPTQWVGDIKTTARRVSYLIAFGEMPVSIGDVCGNKTCVNPAHLTPTKGLKDKVGKTLGTRARKEQNRIGEMLVRKVLTLRKLKHTQASIAKHLGINQNTICTILKMAKLCKQNKLKSYRKMPVVAGRTK